MSLRRTPLRGLSALFILLSPAVGGQLLSLLHPCPVEMSWHAPADGAAAAQAPMAGMAGMAMPTAASDERAAPSGAPAHQHGGPGSCRCLGKCDTPALASTPVARIQIVLVDAVVANATAAASIESTVALRPTDRLPPPTAPPSA